MYMLNGWWFLSSSGSYPPVFMVDLMITYYSTLHLHTMCHWVCGHFCYSYNRIVVLLLHILYFILVYLCTPSDTFFCNQWFGKCDPPRICGFCTRVGLAISESHSI